MSDTTAATKDGILDAVRGLIDPTTRRDLVSLGYLKNIAYCDGIARISMQTPASVATDAYQVAMKKAISTAVMRIAGVTSVDVEFTVQPASSAANALPGVKHVIAVGAGKGGVGKSTVAVLAAVGLRRAGLRVGILDADVYGPSVPKLTGTEQKQPQVDQAGRIFPPDMDGIRIMSMGYIVAPDQAIVWRGPMAQKYVKEFLERGEWGELDCLIVDLPPGTGDIPLTLAQSIPLTGAVVVCTPQDVALLDAVKALRMYQKLDVAILGIVENMSYYICPHCGERDEIFSHGGAERAATELGVPFLGGIPLNIAIRTHGDTGTPTACFENAPPDVRAALDHFVEQLSQQIEVRVASRRPAPQLRITD